MPRLCSRRVLLRVAAHTRLLDVLPVMMRSTRRWLAPCRHANDGPPSSLNHDHGRIINVATMKARQ